MVLIDELLLDEMNINDELTLLCGDFLSAGDGAIPEENVSGESMNGDGKVYGNSDKFLAEEPCCR